MQWAKVGLDTHIGDGHQSMNQDVPILLGSFWDDLKPKKTCFDPSTYGDYMENIGNYSNSLINHGINAVYTRKILI